MCLYTKYILNPKYRANKKNNYRPPRCKDERLKYVPVSCGRCIECRKKKRREWLVRLSEEIKTDKKCMFVTLTFDDKSFKELSRKVFNREASNNEEENEVCIKAVRMWLERIRAKTGKSIKHWLITEKGEDFGRIHLHGIIWAGNWALNEWGYGYVSHGTYVNEQTINYITKYVTKVNANFKDFIGKILTSKGIGREYIDKYKGSGKADEYITRKGFRINQPDYYRRNIYNDDFESIYREYESRNVDIDVMELICSITSVPKLMDLCIDNEQGGTVNMCEAMKRFQAECESKGRNEGIELGIDTEKVNSIISMLEFGITKEQILTKYTKEDLKRAEAAIANNN